MPSFLSIFFTELIEQLLTIVSGSSRGLSNIVIPIENASIDHFAKELQDIVNGKKSEEHPYYKLTTKTKYRQIHYNFEKSEYTVNEPINPSTTAEESSVPSVSGEFAPTSATEGSSNADQAQIILEVSEDPIVGVQEQITPPTVDRQVPPVADTPELALYFDFA